MPRKNVTLASGDTAHLTEFAHGEDVGHGVDHDCPACRINRQALKKAGLHASDIQGLAGGKPPLDQGGDHFEGESTPRVGAVPATRDIILGPGSDAAPDLDGLKKITERLMEGAPVSADPNDKPIGADPAVAETIRDSASGDIIDERREGDPPSDSGTADRHRRLLALSSRLDDVLSKVMVPRGYSPNLIDGYDTDIAEAIIDNGGRFMLMAGFIPDDRDWHCEIGIGSERSHVQHPDQSIAIRLAMLLALDPKSGSHLNSAFMQLVEEGKPRAQLARHWVGTGVQP